MSKIIISEESKTKQTTERQMEWLHRLHWHWAAFSAPLCFLVPDRWWYLTQRPPGRKGHPGSWSTSPYSLARWNVLSPACRPWADFQNGSQHEESSKKLPGHQWDSTGCLRKFIRSKTWVFEAERHEFGNWCCPLSWPLLHLCFSNRFLCQRHWFSSPQAH